MGKRIAFELENRGTPYGIHSAYNVVNCARSVTLDAVAREAGNYRTVDYYETGGIFHAFCEIYYQTQKPFETKSVDFSEELDIDCLLDAERCFEAYQDQYRPNELGKILEVETVFNSDKDPILLAITGKPVSGRWDLVVKLNKRDCRRIEKYREIEVWPGIWLVDHKLERSVKSGIDEHLNSLQYALYQTAWDILHPKDLASGLLVNRVSKTIKVQFRTLPIGPPNRDVMKAVCNMYEVAAAIRNDKFLKDAANPSVCFFPRVCQHWVSQKCKRY